MRAALVLAGLVAAACGRVGFDRMNARPGDGGSVPPACVAATGLDWLGGAVPNDPGSGLPHPASLTVTADGMAAIDGVTGLEWQRGSSPGPLPYDEATAYCASLALEGCSLWRLPQRIELASLVDHTEVDPVIDPVAFPSTPTDVDCRCGELQRERRRGLLRRPGARGRRLAPAVDPRAAEPRR